MKISESMSPEQQAQIRQYQRDQKREQRKRQRLERDQRILAEGNRLAAEKINREGQNERAALNVVFFGEDSPSHDATTIESALAVCREFARALAQEDIQPGESLKHFEIRIGRVWMDQGGSFLNRATQQLRKGWGDYWREKNFDKTYKLLPNAAKPVDVASLPSLPEIPISKPEKAPVVPAPVAQVESDDDAERRVLEQKRRMNSFIGLGPDAIKYLTGDKR
jgi:hypothetical protein